MKKRILSVVLSMVMLMSMVGIAGITASAAVQTTTYTTTDNLQGAIDEVKADNILIAATISGAYITPDGSLSGVSASNIKNPANLTDGTYNVKSTMDAKQHDGVHTYTYVVCDLGKSYDITTLLYASDGTQGTNGLAIYVGNDTLATIHGGTVEPVVTYGAIGKSDSAFTPSPKDERGVRFDFTKPVTGRYIIYRLTTGDNDGWEMSWIGEIAALGTLSQVQTTTYTTNDNLQGAIDEVKADNILTVATINGAYIMPDGNLSGVIASNIKNPANLTDGTYNVKSTMDAKQHDGVHTYTYVVCDLGKSYDITTLLYASDGTHGTNGLAIYVGNDTLATIHGGTVEPVVTYGAIGKSDSAFTPSPKDERGVRFDFTKPVTGRYIIYRLTTGDNDGWEMSWIGEIAALGTLPPVQTTTYTTTDNLQGAIDEVKADNILIAATISGAYITPDGSLSGVSASNIKNPANLTDGIYYVKSTMDAEQHGGVHTYTYVVCDLGKSYDITTLLYASDGTHGTNGLAIYVGNDALAAIHGGTVEPVVTYGAIGKSDSAFTPSPKDERGVRFDFTKPVTGRYVIYRLTTGDNDGWEMSWIGEIAATGAPNIQPLVTGVNEVTSANVSNIPANLLVGSGKLKGTLDKNSSPLAALYDGVIGGITDPATNETRVSFKGDSTGFITTAGGKQLQNVNGMAELTFQLTNTSSIDKILVSGSARDDVSFNDEGVTYDNRHVMYYEVYVSEDYSRLYDKDNMVLAYDNSEDPGLAQIHVLEEAVRGSFVGFKVTCGAYSLARLSEIGVYGTMDELTPLEFTGFNNEDEMNALVGDRANLLKGEAIEGLVTDFLPNIGSAIITNNESWLSDDHIDWVASPTGETAKKALYSNTDYNSNLMYDFRGTVDFSGLMLSGVGMEESQYRVSKISIYVGDDMDTIYGADNLVGVATGVNTDVGFYIDLSAYDVEGRYMALVIPGDGNHHVVRIAELGIYGTYLTGPEKFPTNLLFGRLPIYHQQISARSIDNKTAVDVNGNLGSGNTGKFTGEVEAVWKYDDLALLTDGSTSTRSAQYSSASPSHELYEDGKAAYLVYDSNWIVLAYKLDGKTRIDDIVFASSAERNYYVSGVQYYASDKYADLFKNESLLYTTGGEYFVLDEENTVIDPENPENTVIRYLPDASMDDNDAQTIEYTLNEEQNQKLYRYVAVVMTRPHSMYNPSDPTERLEGWSIFRASEITVHGELVEEDPPIKDTYTVETSVGDVTVQIGTLHYDDFDFLNSTLGGVKVTETKLPASVNPNVDDNWRSVDIDTVFTFQLVDKNGKVIPETHEDETLGLNGRELELQFPSTADYVQTMAVLEDGVLHRLYNSFTNINKDNKINAGCLVYPTYTEGVPNNRDRAVLSGTKVSLVYMKANDYNTVDKLSNRVVNDSLVDFVADGGAAGVTADGVENPLRYVLPALAVALVAVVTVTVLMHRKARRAGQ